MLLYPILERLQSYFGELYHSEEKLVKCKFSLMQLQKLIIFLLASTNRELFEWHNIQLSHSVSVLLYMARHYSYKVKLLPAFCIWINRFTFDVRICLTSWLSAKVGCGVMVCTKVTCKQTANQALTFSMHLSVALNV